MLQVLFLLIMLVSDELTSLSILSEMPLPIVPPPVICTTLNINDKGLSKRAMIKLAAVRRQIPFFLVTVLISRETDSILSTWLLS
jgi:hypothetical protein